jgi:hypothetical protein
MVRMRARHGPTVPILLITTFAVASLAQRPDPAAPPNPAQSHDTPTGQVPTQPKVRAAWLSGVKGDVALAQHTGDILRKAFANAPVEEHSLIQTGIGRAEIDFVGGSAVRLAPFSAVEFSRIELLPSGATASTLQLLKGTVYISLMPSYLVNAKGSEVRLSFGEQSLRLLPSSHIRLELKDAQANLAMLDGPGQVESPSGPVSLASRRTVIFDLPLAAHRSETKKIEHRPMDKWDSNENELQRRAVDWEKHIVRHFQ